MTAVRLELLCQDLRDLSAKLAPATGALNAALIDLGQVLADAQLGVTASVDLGEGTALVFGKRDGKWGLFAETTAGWEPITNAPRRVRMMIGPAKIEELLCALKGRMALELQDVADHTAKVRDLIVALQGAAR